jgi:hypothetical protein
MRRSPCNCAVVRRRRHGDRLLTGRCNSVHSFREQCLWEEIRCLGAYEAGLHLVSAVVENQSLHRIIIRSIY